MQISRRADYALRAIRFLSRLPKDDTASISRIAEGEAIPREFLAKILKELADKEVIQSFRGVTGGYGLARRPKQITYLQVIEAVEGPLHLNLCTEFGGSYCKRSGNCEMHAFWVRQEESLKRRLASTNFGKYAKRTGSARSDGRLKSVAHKTPSSAT
jgi:Rrf2 family protein